MQMSFLQILLNPFTDIVPRLAAKPPKKSKEEKKKEKEAVPAPKKFVPL
jgi:hypothetical protein